jgi:hypothetical protein
MFHKTVEAIKLLVSQKGWDKIFNSLLQLLNGLEFENSDILRTSYLLLLTLCKEGFMESITFLYLNWTKIYFYNYCHKNLIGTTGSTCTCPKLTEATKLVLWHILLFCFDCIHRQCISKNVCFCCFWYMLLLYLVAVSNFRQVQIIIYIHSTCNPISSR